MLAGAMPLLGLGGQFFEQRWIALFPKRLPGRKGMRQIGLAIGPGLNDLFEVE